MTTDDLLEELTELSAFLAEHVDAIPAQRRRQALLTLERVERMIPDMTGGFA